MACLKLVFLVIFSTVISVVKANPVVYTSPGLRMAEDSIYIIIVFFVNIGADAILLYTPIKLIYKTGLDSDLPRIWPFTVPIIAFWGAFVDLLTFESIDIIDSPVLSVPAAAAIIFMTYIIVVFLVLKKRMGTALITATLATAVNLAMWSNLDKSEFVLAIYVMSLLLSLIFMFYLFLEILTFFKEMKSGRTGAEKEREETIFVYGLFHLFLPFFLLIFAFVVFAAGG